MNRTEDSTESQLLKKRNRLMHSRGSSIANILHGKVRLDYRIGQPYDPRHMSMSGRPTKAPLAH